MIQSVRYQVGHLYEDHGAWFVRFRLGIRQANGSVKMQRTAERLGSVEDFATKADVEAVRMAFMQKVNGAQTSPHPSMTLSEFSEEFYLPWVERELRASTYKGYRDIWNLYLSERVGQIRLRRFRTVDASKMLRAIADDCDLTKTTLQHIKSVPAVSSRMRKTKVRTTVRTRSKAQEFPGTLANRERLTLTTWSRFCAFSRCCRCCPKQQ